MKNIFVGFENTSAPILGAEVLGPKAQYLFIEMQIKMLVGTFVSNY